jgi:hypothetical protein
MGIPYSRQINAAFEQVTPLVAAGFKVLRTTRDISILLAIIQVLTVLLLGLILCGLVALLYCVNPDLEVRCLTLIYHISCISIICVFPRKKMVSCLITFQYERTTLVTPLLQSLARITLFGIVRSLVSTCVALGAVGWAVWKFFLVKKWVEDVEYEGNVNADEALENLEEEEEEKEEKKGEEEKKANAKGGKGKKK